MKKLIVVINGAGGVGKDTLCSFAARDYRVRNVSSITPILAVARAGGWDGVKTDRSRKLLSDLKALFTGYNDLCQAYVLDQCRAFLAGDEQVLFVHIREPEEITRFVDAAPAPVISLLVTSTKKAAHIYQNSSDDNVANYAYDCTYDNILPLEETDAAFRSFFSGLFARYAFEA